eukprot:COSAG02_NODE_5373_length_4390_cov_3.127709_2_plen_494_part_00
MRARAAGVHRRRRPAQWAAADLSRMVMEPSSTAWLLVVAVVVAVLVGNAAAADLVGTCKVFPKTDFNGHDLKSGKTGNFEQCCSLCDGTAGCNYWTFMPPRTCYMKTSAAGRRPSPDAGASAYTSGCKNASCILPPPSPPPNLGSYGCDPHGGERGVCVNGAGNFPNSSCGGGCASTSQPARCTKDWDCSLAGTCVSGKCVCDAWASGSDCSYLNFQPIDRKSGLGYIDPTWSSWGGNAVLGKDRQWHLFMAEIGPSGRKGLGGWQSHSQVAHAVSDSPAGPYKRKALVAAPEHHNPTLKVSPVDGTWHLYSIDKGSGPIVVSSSSDEGETWTSTTPGSVVSAEQNPGPFLWNNGSMTMWYRDHATTSSPCSDESIGVQYCSNATAMCSGGFNPVYTHTSEDPSVFIDTRGNYHMLINALPGRCSPKLQQGGHAWSQDGITWSEPRVGAYNTTVVFTDGTNMTCNRRERPQIVQDCKSSSQKSWTHHWILSFV